MTFYSYDRHVASKSRLDVLDDELAELEDLQGDLEGFVFMEEEATKLMHKVRELAKKYPDLRGVDRAVHSGFTDFHNSVLSDLSNALEELDEAQERRFSEKYELEEGP